MINSIKLSNIIYIGFLSIEACNESYSVAIKILIYTDYAYN